MQIQFGLSNFAPEWHESVVCIGTFDGLHLGHREVIRRAVSEASLQGLPLCLITFDRHPASILHASTCPPGIISLERKLEKLSEMGVGLCIVLAFDQELSEVTAESFLEEILKKTMKARQLVVGHDFAMGHDRVGDAEWLSARIPTEVVPPFEIGGRRVSSSVVRAEITQGNIAEANLLLGEAFAISGVVVAGDRIGRTLGYPTANVARAFRQIMPPDGVYAGSLSLRKETFKAAISIGTRPSVGGRDRKIEAYCLDFEGNDFYGEHCVMKLLQRLRLQIDFPTLGELRDQISEDVKQIRAFRLDEPFSTSLRT